MNEKGDICSSIENHLLYKVAYFIFFPRSILKPVSGQLLFLYQFLRVFRHFDYEKSTSIQNKHDIRIQRKKLHQNLIFHQHIFSTKI
jgi:hypothetical protein